MLDEQERWRLIEQHIGQLRNVCLYYLCAHRRYGSPARRVQLSELVSDVTLFCFNKLADYDSTRGEPEAYLLSLMHYGAKGALRDCASISNCPLSLDTISFNALEQNYTENLQFAENLLLYLQEAVGLLPPRQRYVVDRISRGDTLQAIGDTLGLSHVAVRDEYRKAIDTLRGLLLPLPKHLRDTWDNEVN